MGRCQAGEIGRGNITGRYIVISFDSQVSDIDICVRQPGLRSTICGEMVCELCVKDGRRMGQIVKLIYAANPAALKSGMAMPLLVLKLFIAWCEWKKVDPAVAEEARAMLARWRETDAVDQSEVAVREGGDQGG